MKKFAFFVQFDKEEKWLIEMAKQGYQLTGKSLWYQFERTAPENAMIKIDYRTFKKQEDFADYCALFEDCGWKHLAGTKNSGTHYFKKVEEGGSDEIFSDADSRAGRYQRLAHMWLSLASSFLPILAVLLATGSINARAFFDPKLLYYTPGLWEKTGAAFWGAFLFETPFAFGRGFLWAVIPVMIVLYFVFAYKANKHAHSEHAV